MLHLPLSARPILTVVFCIACAAWILPEVVAWRAKRSSDPSQVRDDGSLNLIVILWWGGIAMAVLMSSLLPQAAMSWKRTSVFLVGICLMLMGVALRWYSAAVLGKYFTFDIAIQSGQALIEAGPYRYIPVNGPLWGVVLPFGRCHGPSGSNNSFSVLRSPSLSAAKARLTTALLASAGIPVQRTGQRLRR